MSTISLTGKTEKKLQKRVPEVVKIQTTVFLASKTPTRTNTLTLMTPPGCYSGAHVLDVSKSVIPSKTPWCESKKWCDSTCCRFPWKAYHSDLFQMQIGLLIIAVMFLGERKGNAMLWSGKYGWPWQSEKEGQRTPGEWPCEKAPWDWLGQNSIGNGNLWLCRFLLELDHHSDFWQPLSLLCWLRLFTDLSTESKSPPDL